MPEEQIYKRRIGTAGPQQAVLSQPQDYGAGVAGTVARLGEQQHAASLRAYRLDRQENAASEAADAAKRFTQLRTEMDEASREARSTHAPGAKGHAKAMAETLEKRREELLAGITEDTVRQQVELQFDDYAQRFGKVEGDFEEGRRIDKLVTDTGDSIDIARNRVRTNKGDSATYAEELTQQIASIYALPGISDDVKDKLAKEAEQGLSVSYLQGLMDVAPDQAKAAIDAGRFNDLLDPEQLEALKNGSDVEIRRIEAEKERQAAMAKAELNERIATVKELDGQGIEIPDATLGELEAAAALIGDTSTVAELQGLRANNAFAKQWEKATPVQREQRLAILQAKKNPSEAEQREIKWLEDKSGALDSAFNSDPYSAAQAAGLKPPPPLVLGDPASVKARASWAKAAAKTTGRPVPMLSPNEIALYRERYDAGEGPRLQLLTELDAFKTVPGGTRSQVARQIAPNDKGFQLLAELEPDIRGLAFDGKRALQTKGFFTPAKENKERIDKIIDTYNGRLFYALRRVGGYEEVRTLATQIAAGHLSRSGYDIDGMIEQNYRFAVEHALGKNDGLGGLARWNDLGSFVLPGRYTVAGFETAVMRDLRAKKDNPPVNPDGSDADLKRAIPVMVGMGRYQWETPRRQPILAKDGTPYTTEVAVYE